LLARVEYTIATIGSGCASTICFAAVTVDLISIVALLARVEHAVSADPAACAGRTITVCAIDGIVFVVIEAIGAILYLTTTSRDTTIRRKDLRTGFFWVTTRQEQKGDAKKRPAKRSR
jgi:hypothetical protein